MILLAVMVGLIFYTLYITYRVLKPNHLILSTTYDVLVYSLVNTESLRAINQDIEYLEDIEYTIYQKFNFKIFLLYLAYCFSEDFLENLHNELNS